MRPELDDQTLELELVEVVPEAQPDAVLLATISPEMVDALWVRQLPRGQA